MQRVARDIYHHISPNNGHTNEHHYNQNAAKLKQQEPANISKSVTFNDNMIIKS